MPPHGPTWTDGPDLPRVSVVVPTYSRPREAAGCVDSILALEYPPDRLEIIVVDDGSPVPVVLPAPGEGRPDVRLVRQENAGPARARNHGARVASGDVLAFTDDDCRPHPLWLRHMVAALVEEPDALVGGHTVNALEGNIMAEASQTLVDYLYAAFPSAQTLRPFFTSNNIAVSASPFRRLGGFDESFRFSAGEDRDFSERWSSRGPLRFVPEARVLHHHALSPWRFLRQHHFYGRGAAHLARRRRGRGDPPPSVEPLSFYGRMLTFPIRTHGPTRGMPIAALLAVSQVATVTGIVLELLRPSTGDSGPT